MDQSPLVPCTPLPYPTRLPCRSRAQARISTVSPSETVVIASDALAVEACRRPPHPRAAERRRQVVVDRIGDVGDGRRRGRARAAPASTIAVLAQVDADQAGECPDARRGTRRARRRRGPRPRARRGIVEAPRRARWLLVGGLVGARRGDERRLVDAGDGDLGEDGLELGGIAVRSRAVDDRVGRAQHAEQRPAAAPIVASRQRSGPGSRPAGRARRRSASAPGRAGAS